LSSKVTCHNQFLSQALLTVTYQST